MIFSEASSKPARGWPCAIQMEHSNCVKDFDEKLRCEQEANQSQKVCLEHHLTQATEEARRQADAVTTLESQIKELRHALVHAEKNAESAAELGRATAQTEILKRRIEELLSERRVHDSHSAGRIRELEEELRAGEALRRKMHNVIQELRGNVRVFARVRPFLPSDGVSADSQSAHVLSVRDHASLRIMKAAADNHRAEDHSFTFDKAFGQSASQVHIYVTCSYTVHAHIQCCSDHFCLPFCYLSLSLSLCVL